ncbi:sodium/glutamate symporter [Bryobacterales bacterium F-183]|nr:sodium/glutamate symporter [Bryobacterales bacterium F-183]
MAPVAEWKIGGPESLALGALAVLIGLGLRSRIPLLVRWSIPAAVAGGLCIALAVAGLRGRWVNITADASLRDLLSLICFTIIGLNASLRVLVRGGAAIPVMLAVAGVGAVLQNLVGSAAAWAFGLNPMVGPLAGSVALCGGPATSVAFGAAFEAKGVPGAASIAVASATFGIAVGGLLAGRLGQWLVGRREVPVGPDELVGGGVAAAGDAGGSLLSDCLTVAMCIGLGSLLDLGFRSFGLTVPGFIGPMTVAAVWRNVLDVTGWQLLSEVRLQGVFQAVLPLFIGVAVATLRLWELSALALPLVGILMLQTVVTLGFAALASRLFCRVAPPYEGAIMATGFAGFMLGITPNAMASMEELTRRYGPAPQAFLTVPIVGGYLNDFVNSLVVTASISMLGLLH